MNKDLFDNIDRKVKQRVAVEIARLEAVGLMVSEQVKKEMAVSMAVEYVSITIARDTKEKADRREAIEAEYAFLQGENLGMDDRSLWAVAETNTKRRY